MKRRESEPLLKVTLNLFERDYRQLQERYATLGATRAIREIVRVHLASTEAKLASIKEVFIPEIDVELDEDLMEEIDE